MATWSFVQGDGSNTLNNLPYPGAVVAGNLLIVGTAGENAVTPGTPTDTRGTAYQLLRALNDTTNSIRSAWWYGIAPSSGANTVNFTNFLNNDAYLVSEFSVDAGNITFDTGKEIGQIEAAGTGVDAFNSTPVTPSVAESLAVAFGVQDGADTTMSGGTGYTVHTDCDTFLDGFPANQVRIESQKVGAVSTDGTWTLSVAGRGMAYIAIFKTDAAPPAAGDTTTRRYEIRHSRMTSW
jgi:hypothetical protein